MSIVMTSEQKCSFDEFVSRVGDIVLKVQLKKIMEDERKRASQMMENKVQNTKTEIIAEK